MKSLDNPDVPLVLGITPLVVASSCGHVDIVDALIQAGADINKQVIILDSPVWLYSITSQIWRHDKITITRNRIVWLFRTQVIITDNRWNN